MKTKFKCTLRAARHTLCHINKGGHRRSKMRTFVIVTMGLLWLSFGVAQVNGDNLPIDGSWVISNPSVSTANGQLHVNSNGTVDDGWAQKSLSISLSDQNPVVIDARMRLESGGLNYRLPLAAIYFGDGSSLWTTYLPTLDSNGPYGWHFTTASGDASWSGIENPPVPGSGYWDTATANYWAVIRIVLAPTGGQLFLKPDDASQGWFSDQFEPVLSTTWSTQSTIANIRFQQPWDAAFTVDYVNVTVAPEPSTWALLAVGVTAFLIRRRRHLIPK
jgi:hypothetical protein